MRSRVFAAFLLAVPGTGYTQGAPTFDRNGTWQNAYVCETVVLNKMASETPNKNWIGSVSGEKKSYNIDVVSAYSENEAHNAKATQYLLKQWAKGRESKQCFQRAHASFHAFEHVVISIGGTLECEMDGERGATDRWSFNFYSGRFIRVRSEGYVNREDGYVPGPEMEIGTCKVQ